MPTAFVHRDARPAPRKRRRRPVPVGAAVLSAVAVMGFWQLRASAQPASAVSPAASVESVSQENRVEAPDRDEDSSADAAADARRMREGARLTNHVGHFRQSGDTVTFVDEQGRDIGGLPNLNLERVIRMLKGVDEPERVCWSISGTITEFSGRNYVLISRAVYKAASPPPSPDQLEE